MSVAANDSRPCEMAGDHVSSTRHARAECPLFAGREEDDVAPGQGLDGMRRRLESVGGRLDVRRRGTEDQTFTATAWVPVRTVYS